MALVVRVKRSVREYFGSGGAEVSSASRRSNHQRTIAAPRHDTSSRTWPWPVAAPQIKPVPRTTRHRVHRNGSKRAEGPSQPGAQPQDRRCHGSRAESPDYVLTIREFGGTEITGAKCCSLGNDCCPLDSNLPKRATRSVHRIIRVAGTRGLQRTDAFTRPLS